MRPRGLVAGLVVTAVIAAGVPAEAGAVTLIGQAPPSSGSMAACFTNSESYQGGVSSGNDYVVTGPGVIIEWRTMGDPADAGDLNTMRVYSGSTAVIESKAETLTAGTLNRFATRIPVTAGERIGLAITDGGADSTSTCGRGAIGTNADFTNFRQPIAPVGSATPMTPAANTNFRLDLAALIEADADGDGFGDETQDGCVGSAGPDAGCPAPVPPPPPDTTAPVTTISATPTARTKKTEASFEFAADDPAASFECALDKNPFFPCESPVRFGHVKRKRHTFQVRATDAAGNVGQAAVFHWKVRKRHKR